MSNMVTSTIQPIALEPDTVENGDVRVLVHWDIKEIEIVDENGTRTEWQYQEQPFRVNLPKKEYIEQGEYRPVLSEAGFAYLAENEDEILNWAQSGMIEAPEVLGGKQRVQELEDAIVELSVLLAGGGL